MAILEKLLQIRLGCFENRFYIIQLFNLFNNPFCTNKFVKRIHLFSFKGFPKYFLKICLPPALLFRPITADNR